MATPIPKVIPMRNWEKELCKMIEVDIDCWVEEKHEQTDDESDNA